MNARYQAIRAAADIADAARAAGGVFYTVSEQAAARRAGKVFAIGSPLGGGFFCALEAQAAVQAAVRPFWHKHQASEPPAVGAPAESEPGLVLDAGPPHCPPPVGDADGPGTEAQARAAALVSPAAREALDAALAREAPAPPVEVVPAPRHLFADGVRWTRAQGRAEWHHPCVRCGAVVPPGGVKVEAPRLHGIGKRVGVACADCAPTGV